MHYLGVDFGLKRVGLATSQGELASPLKTIEVRGFKDAVQKIVELTRAEDFDKIIVGLPEGKIGNTVLRFVAALRQEGLDVSEADETLSTKFAMHRMVEEGVSKDRRKTSDAYSAAIILQDYIESLNKR